MLDPSDAERVLRPLFPSVVVEALTERTGGENSAVYQVRCSHPSTEVIVKVYPEQLGWKLDKEAYIYRLLGAQPALPTPRVLLADGSRRLLDHGYLVMSRLDGEVLSEVGPRLRQQDHERLYRRLGTLLAMFHRLEQPAFGYLATGIVDPVPTNARYMRERFDKKLAEFGEYGGDATLRAAVERFVHSHGHAFAACPGAVLCHNDFYEGNVLVTRTTHGWDVSGIIDVENAIAADPLLDIAKTAYYSIHQDPTKMRALLDGYGTPPATWPAAFPLYRLFHALELWGWYARIGNDPPLDGIAGDMAAIIS